MKFVTVRNSVENHSKGKSGCAIVTHTVLNSIHMSRDNLQALQWKLIPKLVR